MYLYINLVNTVNSFKNYRLKGCYLPCIVLNIVTDKWVRDRSSSQGTVDYREHSVTENERKAAGKEALCQQSLNRR